MPTIQKRKTTMKIEDIITQRLKLQSTQKVLEAEFGINDFSNTNITNYLDGLSNLPEKRQKKFITTLGGPANYKKTLSYIQTL